MKVNKRLTAVRSVLVEHKYITDSRENKFPIWIIYRPARQGHMQVAVLHSEEEYGRYIETV